MVAIGKLPEDLSPSDPQPHGAGVDFEVEGTGFIYVHTPIQSLKESRSRIPTGAVYFWALIWVVTCKHCDLRDPFRTVDATPHRRCGDNVVVVRC